MVKKTSERLLLEADAVMFVIILFIIALPTSTKGSFSYKLATD